MRIKVGEEEFLGVPLLFRRIPAPRWAQWGRLMGAPGLSPPKTLPQRRYVTLQLHRVSLDSTLP